MLRNKFIYSGWVRKLVKNFDLEQTLRKVGEAKKWWLTQLFAPNK